MRRRGGCTSATGSGYLSPGRLSNEPEHESCKLAPSTKGMRVSASGPFGPPGAPLNSVAGTRFLSSLEKPFRLLVGVRSASQSQHTRRSQNLSSPRQKALCSWCFAQSCWERLTWFSQLRDGDTATKNKTHKKKNNNNNNSR